MKQKQIKTFIDTVGNLDYSVQANSRKEVIYNKIIGKIRPDEITEIPIEADKKRPLILKIAAAAAVAFLLATSSMYFYHLGSHKNKEDLFAIMQQTYTLSSPLGVQAETLLPDGTKVVLNGGSSISYPAVFAPDCREIVLKGEAYLEVSKDETKPFFVKINELNIKVLGTRFCVKSYEEDDKVQVTLAEGSIEVETFKQFGRKTISMSPNMQLTLNKTNYELGLNIVDASKLTDWRNGNLYFYNETFHNIASQLKRQFNVNIHIKDPQLRNETFFCQFDKGENVQQILDLILHKSKWKYVIAKNQIEIVRR